MKSDLSCCCVPRRVKVVWSSELSFPALSKMKFQCTKCYNIQSPSSLAFGTIISRRVGALFISNFSFWTFNTVQYTLLMWICALFYYEDFQRFFLVSYLCNINLMLWSATATFSSLFHQNCLAFFLSHAHLIDFLVIVITAWCVMHEYRSTGMQNVRFLKESWT